MEKTFIEVQNDATEKACYNTFAFTPFGKKYGFLYISLDNYFVGQMAFDSAEDWAELVGCEPQEFSFLEGLDVGEMADHEDIRYTRIW